MVNTKNNLVSFLDSRLLFSILFIILIIYKILVINQFPYNQRIDSSGFALGHIEEIYDSWYNYNFYPVSKDVGEKLFEGNIDNEIIASGNVDTSIRLHTGASIIQGDFLRAAYATPNYLLFNKVSPLTSNIIISLFSFLIFNIFGLIKRKFLFTLTFSFFLVLSDFYIYENYFNHNIFGLSISLFLIIFSSFMLARKKSLLIRFVTIFILTVLISIFTNIRTELSLLFFSLIFLFLASFKFREFISYTIVAFIIFILSNNVINSYYLNKISETNKLISSMNGVVYTGPILSMHTLSHPLWMGLGDNKYGRALGHKWEDNVARLRVAELRPDIFTIDDLCGSRVCIYHDGHMTYPSYAEYMPGYQETLRDDIYVKFKNNKKIFVLIFFEKLKNQFTKLQGIHLNPNFICIKCEKNIFLKNLKAIFFNELPPSKDDYKSKLFLISGFVLFLIGASLFIIFTVIEIFKSNLKKYYNDLKVERFFIFSSIPLAIPALIISDLGATYSSIFHFGLLSGLFSYLILKIKTHA